MRTGRRRTRRRFARSASLAAALLALLFVAPSARADTTLGTGQLRLVGTSFDVEPVAQAVPVGVPAVLRTLFGGDPAGLAQAGLRVSAELSGPGLAAPVTLTTAPGADLRLPALQVRGEYRLEAIRLTDGSGTSVPAVHPVATVVVTDVLVSSVTSRVLTPAELADRGIVVDDRNFKAFCLKTTETDPDGGITRFDYDLAGRLEKRTDPLGYATRWEYDLRGKLLKVTDAKGNPTTYAYDARGLLLAETRGAPVDHPPGTSNLPTWRFTYDARGIRETATDPNGTVQTFTHDDAGRLTGRSVQKAPGVGGVDATSFTLDVLGRPYAEWAQSGPTRVDRTRRFDSLDRAREEALRIGTGPQRSLARTFDADDNPVSLTYPSGRTISSVPDPLNRLAEVRSAAGDVLVRYDDLGSRQLRKVLGNGLTEERQYDPSGWLEHLDVGPAANPNGTFSVTYGRNGRSLKTDVTRADLGKRHAYEYDAASRILREQLGLLEPPPPAPAPNPPEVENDLTLDGLLNIVTEERTEAGTKVTTSSATNSRNQVTQWGADAATWDANGNVASFRGRTLHYDADNRLVSAVLPGGGTYEVLRDASGRKVRETLTASGISHAVDIVQDGDRTLETFAVNEGVPLESLVYGRGIDEVVRADLDPDGDGTATTVIPIQDELGNVTHLTDQSGAVVERYQYEGYGKFRIFDPANSPRTVSSFGWNRLFQGREYLGIVDAYDFRNRLLIPELGRFAQEDPARYGDSPNLYQGFLGSWGYFTDPLGLWSRNSWLGIAGERRAVELLKEEGWMIFWGGPGHRVNAKGADVFAFNPKSGRLAFFDDKNTLRRTVRKANALLKNFESSGNVERALAAVEGSNLPAELRDQLRQRLRDKRFEKLVTAASGRSRATAVKETIFEAGVEFYDLKANAALRRAENEAVEAAAEAAGQVGKSTSRAGGVLRTLAQGAVFLGAISTVRSVARGDEPGEAMLGLIPVAGPALSFAVPGRTVNTEEEMRAVYERLYFPILARELEAQRVQFVPSHLQAPALQPSH